MIAWLYPLSNVPMKGIIIHHPALVECRQFFVDSMPFKCLISRLLDTNLHLTAASEQQFELAMKRVEAEVIADAM